MSERTKTDVTRDLLAISRYPIRRCRSLHQCLVCGGDIRDGELYHDGEFDRRAHKVCIARALEETDLREKLAGAYMVAKAGETMKGET